MLLLFGFENNGDRKIAPQQIPPWVWVRTRVGSNLPGGNFPSTENNNRVSK